MTVRKGRREALLGPQVAESYPMFQIHHPRLAVLAAAALAALTPAAATAQTGSLVPIERVARDALDME